MKDVPHFNLEGSVERPAWRYGLQNLAPIDATALLLRTRR